ncbi:MAG: translation initiation factor IF-2 N-terminal domain-containing protein, partial [Deltaproteobacteria bacterium]|nr:translation initiation factor IF-2 N-terminal domain-containing protein [Deltaproteobacteria bacterium]
MTGAKMRVYEIAKEVGIPNKDLLAKIRALGLEANNHMSSLDADAVARIRRSLEKEKASAAPQQTQKLSSGTVLRRRSSGEKTSDASPGDEVSSDRPSVAPRVIARPASGPSGSERPAPSPVTERPTPGPSAPVIRRRVEEPAAPVARPEPRVVRPATPDSPARPVVAAPVVREAPPVQVASAPSAPAVE